jgi:hypothetical chaperone protein
VTARAASGSAWCAIDFGTSNSAVAVARADGIALVELEAAQTTIPTAVFYRADVPEFGAEPARLYGRAAVAAYIEGIDGRLMRSMKSILGSPLAEQGTDVGGGRAVRYLDVIAGFLRHLKQRAEAEQGRPIERAVLGRPVFFVDDDAERDAAAQAALEAAARQAGFAELHFQYEPIAAALDHERSVGQEELVLVCDIGGGTSDFSLVRVGPEHAAKPARRDDILANHGVHVAGTDFDRHVELAAILPLLGYRSLGPALGRARFEHAAPREVPSSIYFDLATWHLINTAYNPKRVAEWRGMKDWFGEPLHHRRLMTVLEERLGHALAAAAEAAKIKVAQHGHATIDLGDVQAGLTATLGQAQAASAIEGDLARIVQAAAETVRLAGVARDAVQTLYFTGGSTGLTPLVERIAAQFPGARQQRGDRFASVVAGLGVHALALYG